MDKRDGALQYLGSRTSQPKDVGRQGDGPNEYRSPTELFPLGGDSTLLTDTQGRRWLILSGAQIVATYAPGAAVIERIGWNLTGGDGSGALLALKGFNRPGSARPFGGSGVGESDSLIVVRARLDRGMELPDFRGGC